MVGTVFVLKRSKLLPLWPNLCLFLHYTWTPSIMAKTAFLLPFFHYARSYVCFNTRIAKTVFILILEASFFHIAKIACLSILEVGCFHDDLNCAFFIVELDYNKVYSIRIMAKTLFLLAVRCFDDDQTHFFLLKSRLLPL